MLSARMSQVEQELHSDTFTPRKQKRVGSNRQASDSLLFGITNRTEANTSLEESMAQSRGPEGIRIPVHTHSTTNTTSTSTASLFAQSSQACIQQNTQTIFSTHQITVIKYGPYLDPLLLQPHRRDQ